MYKKKRNELINDIDNVGNLNEKMFELEEALLDEKSNAGMFAKHYKTRYYFEQVMKKEEIIDTKAYFNSDNIMYSDALKLIYLAGGMFNRKALSMILADGGDIDRMLNNLAEKKLVYFIENGRYVVLANKGKDVFKPYTANRKYPIVDATIDKNEQVSYYLAHHFSEIRKELTRSKLPDLKDRRAGKLFFKMYRDQCYLHHNKYHDIIGLTKDEKAYISSKKTHSSRRRALFDEKFSVSLIKENESIKKEFQAYSAVLQTKIKNEQYEGFYDYLPVSITDMIQNLLFNTSVFENYRLYQLYRLSDVQNYYDAVTNTNKAKKIKPFIINKNIEELNGLLKAIGGLKGAASASNEPLEYTMSQINEKKTSLQKKKKSIGDQISFTVNSETHFTTFENLRMQGIFIEQAKWQEDLKRWKITLGMLTYQESFSKDFLYDKLRMLINYMNVIFGKAAVEYSFNIYGMLASFDHVKTESELLLERLIRNGKSEYSSFIHEKNVRFIKLL